MQSYWRASWVGDRGAPEIICFALVIQAAATRILLRSSDHLAGASVVEECTLLHTLGKYLDWLDVAVNLTFYPRNYVLVIQCVPAPN